uniref:helix-turn-helix domain-containing protein n=1 Tax=Nocardia suismassiliense TaxID=2077092 RepID=UPI003F490B14
MITLASSKPQYDEEPATDPRAEFLAELRRARRSSGLTGGQIAAKSGLSRTTVYRYVSPDTTTIPRDIRQVERFLRACNLHHHEVTRCMVLWQEVNGRRPIYTSKIRPIEPAQPTVRMRGIFDAFAYLLNTVGTLVIPKVGLLLTSYDDFIRILAGAGGVLFGTAMMIWWSGGLSGKSSKAFLSRVFSWQTGAAIVAGGAAALVIGRMITTWWWFRLSGPPSVLVMDFGSPMQRGMPTGLLFGVLAATLLSFWLRSVDWSALWILVRQFPALPTLAVLMAFGLGVLHNVRFSFSIGGSIVAGLLWATALLFLLDKAMAQTVLAPIVQLNRDRLRARRMNRDHLRACRERQDPDSARTVREIFSAATDLLGTLAQQSVVGVPTIYKSNPAALPAAEVVEQDTVEAFCAELAELKEQQKLSYRQMELRCRLSPFATSKTTLANAVKPAAGLPSLRTVHAFIWSATSGDDPQRRNLLASAWARRWQRLAHGEPLQRSDIVKMLDEEAR